MPVNGGVFLLCVLCYGLCAFVLWITGVLTKSFTYDILEYRAREAPENKHQTIASLILHPRQAWGFILKETTGSGSLFPWTKLLGCSI